MADDLNKKIWERFNQLSETFTSQLKEDDFRLNAILKFMGNVNGKFGLDVGCAKGLFVQKLVEKNARMIGIDPVWDFINEAKINIPNGSFYEGDAIALPFISESFDFVYSIEVIEHIPNTELAIAEMFRIVKKSGKVMIIDKNIFAMNPQLLVPWALFKKYFEMRNQWMYPKNFPFTEKWFNPWKLKKTLEKYSQKVETKFMVNPEHGPRVKAFPFTTFPFLQLFVAWMCVK